MYAVAGQGVEKNGEGSHECLSFTGSHFGDLALVQNGTAEELYVVVYHFPFQVVAAGSPVVVVDGLVAVDGDEVVGRIACQLAVELSGCNYRLFVLGEAACRILHNAEGCGQYLVECYLVVVECFFLQFVYLVEDTFTLIDGCVLDGSFQLGYLLALCFAGILYILLYFLGFGTELVIAQGLDVGVFSLYLFYDGLNELHVACRLVAEQRLEKFVEIHCVLFFFLLFDVDVVCRRGSRPLSCFLCLALPVDGVLVADLYALCAHWSEPSVANCLQR